MWPTFRLVGTTVLPSALWFTTFTPRLSTLAPWTRQTGATTLRWPSTLQSKKAEWDAALCVGELQCYDRLVSGNMQTSALCWRWTTWCGWRSLTGSASSPTFRASTGGSATTTAGSRHRRSSSHSVARPSQSVPTKPGRSRPNWVYTQTYRSVAKQI